jgi:polysaccharide export outer membrane protein
MNLSQRMPSGKNVLRGRLPQGMCAVVVMGLVCGTWANAQWNNGSGAAPNPYVQSAAPGVVTLPGTGQNGSNGQMQGVPFGTMQGTLPTPNQGNEYSQTMQSAMLYPDPKVYVLPPGALISLHIYGVTDYGGVIRISKDGTGEIPLIGQIHLGGLTIEKAQELVADRLKAAGMFRDPNVSIALAEAPKDDNVTIAGEMHSIVPVMGQQTLFGALSAAGGLPAGASRTVTIIRPGVAEPITVDIGTTPQQMAKADVPVYAHDTIYIERAGTVYMLGEFKQPGLIPLTSGPMTLMQAAAMTGGPNFSGNFADMRIVRTVGTQRTEVKVDIKKVLYGTAPDPILQAGDIVFLPPSSLKSLLSSGGVSVLLQTISLALLVVGR